MDGDRKAHAHEIHSPFPCQGQKHEPRPLTTNSAAGVLDVTARRLCACRLESPVGQSRSGAAESEAAGPSPIGTHAPAA